MQTIYAFVYEKINQNKVMSGSTQYSKRKMFVLVPKLLVSWNHSYHKGALVISYFSTVHLSILVLIKGVVDN